MISSSSPSQFPIEAVVPFSDVTGTALNAPVNSQNAVIPVARKGPAASARCDDNNSEKGPYLQKRQSSMKRSTTAGSKGKICHIVALVILWLEWNYGMGGPPEAFHSCILYMILVLPILELLDDYFPGLVYGMHTCTRVSQFSIRMRSQHMNTCWMQRLRPWTCQSIER